MVRGGARYPVGSPSLALRDRSREFWTPDLRWAGETVFVLGCGPSLSSAVVEGLRGRRVLAVNSSFRLAPFSDAVYFTDLGWFEGRWEDGSPRRTAIEKSGALLVTSNQMVKRRAPERICRVSVLPGAPFRRGSLPIRQGRSSGHTAVGLAGALGAKRIVLLGFDMRFVGGRSHFHDEYAAKDEKLYRSDFAPSFRGWAAAARTAGIEILNATTGSALSEFPLVHIEEIS